MTQHDHHDAHKATHARQARNVGLIRILIGALVLAVVVGVVFAFVY